MRRGGQPAQGLDGKVVADRLHVRPHVRVGRRGRERRQRRRLRAAKADRKHLHASALYYRRLRDRRAVVSVRRLHAVRQQKQSARHAAAAAFTRQHRQTRRQTVRQGRQPARGTRPGKRRLGGCGLDSVMALTASPIAAPTT